MLFQTGWCGGILALCEDDWIGSPLELLVEFGLDTRALGSSGFEWSGRFSCCLG